jgi:hypothetical protein
VTISREAAERVARRLGGSFSVLDRTSVEPIAHRVIRRTTAGLARVRLDIRMPHVAATTPHEVIVKELRANAPADDPHLEKFAPSARPDHPNYWLREYLAYDPANGTELPPPLRRPVCYERERGEATATLWLESVPSDPPATWDDAHFIAIAYALGVWQGAASQRLRDEPPVAWWARGSLAMWSPPPGGSAYAAATADDRVTARAMTEAFGPEAPERVHGFWRDRARVTEMLAEMPLSLAHGDCWTRNLLATEDARADIALIDWSELGLAPLAHDLVNLLLDSVWMFDVPPERLAALEPVVLDAYTEGWNACGDDIAREDVERAYRANASLRFGALAGILLLQAASDVNRATLADRYGRSFDAIFAARATVIRAALAVKS